MRPRHPARLALRRTFLVRLASGALLGTMEAASYAEALGQACVLATCSGVDPQGLEVTGSAATRRV